MAYVLTHELGHFTSELFPAGTEVQLVEWRESAPAHGRARLADVRLPDGIILTVEIGDPGDVIEIPDSELVLAITASGKRVHALRDDDPKRTACGQRVSWRYGLEDINSVYLVESSRCGRCVPAGGPIAAALDEERVRRASEPVSRPEAAPTEAELEEAVYAPQRFEPTTFSVSASIWSADSVAEAPARELEAYREDLEAAIERLERALEASVVYSTSASLRRNDHGARVSLAVTDSSGKVIYADRPELVVEWLRERGYVKLAYHGQLSGSYTTGRAGCPSVVYLEGVRRLTDRSEAFRIAARSGELRGVGEAL